MCYYCRCVAYAAGGCFPSVERNQRPFKGNRTLGVVPLKNPLRYNHTHSFSFPAETDFNCLCLTIAWTLSAVVVLIFSHSTCPHFRPLRRDTRPRVSAGCRNLPPCYSERRSALPMSFRGAIPSHCHSEERSDMGILKSQDSI